MKKSILVVSLATLMTTGAVAGERVTLEETFKVDNESTLHFDIPVGSLELNTHDGDEVIIEARVKVSDDGWFADGDLDDAEITKDGSGSRVTFSIDAEDTVQEWTVTVPKNSDLNIDLGVGEVELEDVSRNIYVDVGVGEVEVELASNDYDFIELDSGVGATDLRGFKGERTDRGMVSESTEWRGKGKYEIEIDVGVGEVDVRY